MGVFLYLRAGHRAGHPMDDEKARNRAFNRSGNSTTDHRMVSGFFNCINGDGDKIDDRMAIPFAYICNLPCQWCINDVYGVLSWEKNMVLQF